MDDNNPYKQGVYDMLAFMYIHTYVTLIEGSLEVKLPTVWRDGKAEVGRARRRRKEVRRSEKRKREKKEDAGARKGRKVAIHCVVPMICGSRRVEK